jgi:ABC-type antimicrobial peptide transport system permease subunit
VATVAEQEWLLVGLVIGLLLGIPIGWLISQVLLSAQHAQPASVVFDRDEQGRVVAIHYVPGAGRVS